MRSVSLEPMFDLACGRPRVSVAFIASIARTTIRAFAAGRSFTLLHAITATHALRIIEPYVDDNDSLYQFFWRAYVAAWVSSGALPLRDLADFAIDIEAAPSWDELLPRACASDDEHVVKVAFTAWDEDKAYGDPVIESRSRVILKSYSSAIAS